jgi:hypothetical protein
MTAGAGWERLALVALVTSLFVGCGKRELPTPQKTVEIGVRLTSIEGRVQVKKAGTLHWIDGTLAIPIQKGDLISTDKHATAKLQFSDGSQFDVRPDSVITIIENFHDLISRRPHVGVSIQSGEANFRTPAQPGYRKIETPGGRATPERETEGNVQVARDGKAAVHIYKGKSQVETRTGQQIHLGPSESVQIDAEGTVESKEALSAVPAPLVAPPDQLGAWSGVSRPPQFVLDSIELRGNQLHVAGRTEPEVTVTLNGVHIPVQRDGSFNEHVALEERNAVVSIRATGKSGATIEQRLPVVAGR